MYVWLGKLEFELTFLEWECKTVFKSICLFLVMFVWRSLLVLAYIQVLLYCSKNYMLHGVKIADEIVKTMKH